MTLSHVVAASFAVLCFQAPEVEVLQPCPLPALLPQGLQICPWTQGDTAQPPLAAC